jgi:hypothetical protein
LFDVNKFVGIIPRGERIGIDFLFVLPNATSQVTGNAGVQNRVLFIGRDVSAIDFISVHK